MGYKTAMYRFASGDRYATIPGGALQESGLLELPYILL